MDTANANRLRELSSAAERDLRDNILPFWTTRTVDLDHGGYFGSVSNDGHGDPNEPKGCVLNARILWTFSTVYRTWPEPVYLELAERAFDYLSERFWDKEHSGLVWMVDSQGKIFNDRKQIYANAFGIYAFAEYYRASGDSAALDRALTLFADIEEYAFDSATGGYTEALARDWRPIADMRLSPKDMNTPRSMNTHLHILEAYAGLVRACDDPLPRERLRVVTEIMLQHIIDPITGHLILFQDENWRSLSQTVSFGHDIEASWLICEAADLLKDPALGARADSAALRLAERVLEEGLDREYGGILNEWAPEGHVDPNKEWWVEGEAVVGFLNAYQLSRRDEFLEAALDCWKFIDEHVIDHVNGDWFCRVTPEGAPLVDLPKADLWKCPYHNSRAALEIMERVHKLGA